MPSEKGGKLTGAAEVATSKASGPAVGVAADVEDGAITSKPAKPEQYAGGGTKKAKAKARLVRKSGTSTPASLSVDATGSKGPKGKTRPFPQRTLEEALAVPRAIREKNNGRPMDSDQVAKASLDVSRNNNRFFYAAAASRDYGLTIGGRDSDEVSLTPLGQDIFFAESEEVRKQKLIDAFMGVDIFKKVYEYYGGCKSIPSDGDFFGNVLVKEFQLDPAFHEEFENIFRANCKFLGIEGGLSPVASDKAKAKSVAPKSDEIEVVGAAKGKFDRTAFVIMPFSEKGIDPRPKGFFEAVLNCIIVPAGNSAGFAVETARKKGSDVIHTTIINALLEADLVIADLTDHNPNVLFELGIRLANERPVALIRATGTERIFDVDILRIEDYDPNIWPITVEKDIPKIADHIKATWDNRDSRRPYMEVLTGRHAKV